MKRHQIATAMIGTLGLVVSGGVAASAHVEPDPTEIPPGDETLPLVESIAMHFARAALVRLGWAASDASPQAHGAGDFGRIAPAHRRFFGRLLEIAAGPSGWQGARGSAEAERAAAEEICDRVLREVTDCNALVELMRRCGRRLDETKPGSGLGLSIVADIAQSYRGRFKLEQAALGGLSARLDLPAA